MTEQIGVKVQFDNSKFDKGVANYEKGLAKATKTTTTATKTVNGLGTAFTQMLTIGAIAAVGTMVVNFGTASFETAAKVERLSKATNAMAASLGTSGNAMVEAATKASKGTISQADAFLAANKAMMFGVVESSDDMATMTEIAVTLGAAMGQDAGKSLDDFSTALGRQSKQILDNLGIIMDQELAYRMYADTLGKSVSALTAEEKERAFVNAALEIGAQKVKELGGVAEDATTRQLRLTATWQDFQLAFGKILTGVEGGIGLFDGLSSAVEWSTKKVAEGEEGWGKFFDALHTVTVEIPKTRKALSDAAIETAVLAGDADALNEAIKASPKNWYNISSALVASTDSFEDYRSVVRSLYGEEGANYLHHLGMTADGYAVITQALYDAKMLNGGYGESIQDIILLYKDVRFLPSAITQETNTLGASVRAVTGKYAAYGIDLLTVEERLAAQVEAEEAVQKALDDHQASIKGVMGAQAAYILGLQTVASEPPTGGDPAAVAKSAADAKIKTEQDLTTKLADLAKERADQLHLVETGGMAKGAEQTEKDYQYWATIFDQKEQALKDSYATELETINAGEQEQQAAIAAAKAQQVADQQEQMQDLKLGAALSVMESLGMLDQFFGGMKTTAAEAEAYIKSGLVPITDEMAQAMAGALGTLDETAANSTAQQETNQQVIEDLASGTIPDAETAVGTLAAASKTAGDETKSAFEVMAEAAQETVDEYETMVTSFDGVIDAIVEKIEDVEWSDLGKDDIVGGIVSGIEAGHSDATGAMHDLVLAMLAAAEAAIQSGSPSVLFGDKIGDSIVQGILGRIENVPAYDTTSVWDSFVRQNLADAFTSLNDAGIISDKVTPNEWLDFVDDLGYKRYWDQAWNELSKTMDIDTKMGDLYDQVLQRTGELAGDQWSGAFQVANEAMKEIIGSQIEDIADMTLAQYAGLMDARVKEMSTLATRFGSLGQAFAQQWETQGASEAYTRLRALERERALRQDTAEIDAQIAAERQNILATEQAITNLQQSQQGIQYLQQQMDLVEMMRTYGLNPANILGGMTLGLDADPGLLAQAMAAATEGMLQALNLQVMAATPGIVSVPTSRDFPLGSPMLSPVSNTQIDNSTPEFNFNMQISNDMDLNDARGWIVQTVREALG